jgi:tetratricopeptide (TPR) repeat protein
MKSLRYVILVVVCVACQIARAQSEPSIALIVFPAENLTKSSSLSWIGECLTASICESLELPGVRIIPRLDLARLVESSDLPPNVTLSRASMIRVAQKAAADYLVFGSYSGTSDAIQVGVQVLDLKSMKLNNQITSAGSAVALPQMENELAWQILNQKGLAPGMTREKFRERTRAIPNLPYTYYIRSLSQTDPEARQRLLLKAVEQYSDIPEAQFYLGNYYYKKGDCRQAIRHLDLAHIKPPRYLDSQFMLGLCYVKQDAFAEAAQAFSAILTYARPPEVLNNAGASYLRVGDYPQSLQYLAEARGLVKNDAVVAINLAIVYHLRAEENEALSVLEETLRLHPNVAILHYLVGLVAEAQGQSERANAALQQASRLGADPVRLRSQDLRTLAQILPLWRAR